MSNNECNNQMFTFGADGSVYANLNLYMGTWSDMGDCREVKWDANGNFCWEVGQLNAGAWQASTAYSVGQVVYPTVLNTYAYECTAAGTSGTSQPTWPTTVGNTVGDGGVTWTCFATAYFAATHTCNPGQIWSAFRNGSGVTHGCTVVTDLNGGYAGSGTVYAYCWDANGLWVGNPFETDNCDSTNCPIDRYTLSSEDENGSMYTDPTTGNVYYFGGQESELRVYQITGWNSGSSPWTYLGGFVTGSSICLAPTFSPTASNYHSAQTVTISTATGGASIRYTTDGTTPSSTVGTVYSNPVTISGSCTLQAIAYENGYTNSTVTNGVYTITGPLGIFTANQDIGSTGVIGGSCYTNGVYTIWGSGPDTAQFEAYTADAGQFCYEQVNGDCTIIARVTNVTCCNFTQAAVVIRDSLNAGAAGAETDLTQSPSLAYNDFCYRLTDNTAGAWVTVSGVPLPSWLKLVRSGNNFSSYYSSDGSSWTQLGATQTISMSNPVYVGLGVNGGVSGTLETATFDNVSVTGASQCAAPTFSPGAGVYGATQTVTIGTVTNGASINYTTNGVTPSSTVGTLYSSPLAISDTSTLEAIAYASGDPSSWVTSGVYTINSPCVVPTFSPVAGTYTSVQTVTLSTSTSGANINYTTNGTAPSNTVGTLYSLPVSISSTCTLEAIAYESGSPNSTVASGVYAIQICAVPTFNPAAGTYSSAQTVTISTITSGASIRYTTDGTTPNSTVGTVYSSPVTISSACTLQAIAYNSGYANSTVTSGAYIFVGPLGVFTANQDIGTTGAAGSSSYASCIYTVSGAGASWLYGRSSDTGQFCYEQINGNCTIIARLTSLTVASYVAQGCVLVRDSLAVGAAGACQDYETYSNTNYDFMYRLTDNGTIGYTTQAGSALPCWEKLVRSGNSFTGYYSTDGANWTQLGAAQTITMTDPVYIGLGVCSGVSGTLVTATFDNVSVTGQSVCAAPTFNPAAGTYGSAQTVTISTTTGGAPSAIPPTAPHRAKRSARSTAAR